MTGDARKGLCSFALAISAMLLASSGASAQSVKKKPHDVCSNLTGVQKVVPVGYARAGTKCVKPTPKPPAPPIVPTSATLVCNPLQVTVGQPVNCTYTVSASDVAPAGYFASAYATTPVTCNASGTAAICTFSYTTSTVGALTVSVSYTSTNNHAANQAQASITVVAPTWNFSGAGLENLPPFTNPVPETLCWTSSWPEGGLIGDPNGDMSINDNTAHQFIVDANDVASGCTYLVAGTHQLWVNNEGSWTITVHP